MVTISSAEWLFWCCFYAVEPFGPRQEERRAGEIATAAASVGGARLVPADFFPSLRGPKPNARSGWAALCPALTPIR